MFYINTKQHIIVVEQTLGRLNMEETKKTLCEQLNAQVELSEQLVERNLETPEQFVARVNNESRYSRPQRKLVAVEPFPIEFQIKAYERAIKIYSSKR